MNVYLLEKKNVGACSWEHHVYLAKNKTELEKVVKESGEDIRQFDVTLTQTKAGRFYTSIY